MLKVIPILKRSLLAGLAVLLASCMPLTALAATPVCTPPPSTQPGIHEPTGSDAGTYVYNCDTSLWENDHFTYNPLTGQTVAKDPSIFTYNPSSGNYDTTVWTYDAPQGQFVSSVQSTPQPPAGATVIGAPQPVTATPGSSTISNTGPGSTNTINNNGGNGSQSISNTGPNSTNSLGGSNSNNLNVNNLTNATVNNLLSGQATTGDSIVLGNTTGGSATSGNAQDVANVVNLLQSSSNALGGKTATFVANINGDVNGDLLLDPSALGAIQPASSANPSGNNNLTLNNQTNATLNNNINLAADSGNASVAKNTSGGNATSGSAEAIANVVNLINSAISGGKSFVGVININGNFNGDILMPPNFLDQLVASNVPTVSIDTTGPGSTNTINSNTGSNNTNVTNVNNQAITNHINANSTSGNAAVANNTAAGSATSGSAGNSITAFNLTGSNVIGSNDLLVFVNVTGKWVGMIVNAPAGATAAELGGGITTNGQNGNNNTTVNNATNENINNNINVNAKSGNANVSSNTKGGNATSGNAKTAVNLLNIANSNLSLSNWFGILFINVFGTWNGSFGINTSAGDPVASSSNGGNATPAGFKVFSFVPKSTSSGNTGNFNIAPFGLGGNSNTTGASGGTTAPFNASLANAIIPSGNSKSPIALVHSHGMNWGLVAITGPLFVAFIIGDQLYTSRRQSRSKA